MCFKVPTASDRIGPIHIAFPSFPAFGKRTRSNTSIGLVNMKLISVRPLARTICSSGFGSRYKSGSYLEPAIDGFQPLQRVQELQADVSHLIRTRRELLRVLDGKPYAVDGNTRLVRHLELHCCGLAVRPSLNRLNGLFHEFAFHIYFQFRLQAPMAPHNLNSTAGCRLLQKSHPMPRNEGRPLRPTLWQRDLQFLPEQPSPTFQIPLSAARQTLQTLWPALRLQYPGHYVNVHGGCPSKTTPTLCGNSHQTPILRRSLPETLVARWREWHPDAVSQIPLPNEIRLDTPSGAGWQIFSDFPPGPAWHRFRGASSSRSAILDGEIVRRGPDGRCSTS